jgi:hypothetical protein
VIDYENKHARVGEDHVSLAKDDILAVYSVHLFLHAVNMGGGLAFLLHSTMKEADFRRQDDHEQRIVRVGHSSSHIWAAIHQMRWTQAMLFCVAHTEGRVCPHAAYPVDTAAPGYKARRSLEVKFLVKESRRRSDQRVEPIPILLQQPAVQPAVKPRSIKRWMAKLPALLGGKGEVGKDDKGKRNA